MIETKQFANKSQMEEHEPRKQTVFHWEDEPSNY